MSNQPSDDMEEIEKQFEQIMEGLIPLLPTDDRTKIIRKEANRREKVRIEVRATKAKEDELKSQREAFDAERKRQGEQRFDEWCQLVGDLEKLLANVPEARPLLRRMTELLSGRQEELPGNAEELLLSKEVDEKRNEFQTPLEKEMDERTRQVFASLPTEKDEGRKEPASHIDFVTGAYSSRFLDDVLTWETARADRYDYPLTMLLIDLDDFKLVNDTYGHVVGNKVLTSLARLLRSSLREADVVFRSGGDEFTVLLPFTYLSDAVHVRDRILRRVRTSDLLPGRPGKVGVTIVMEEYKVAEGKESFRARLDQALSWAKRNDDDGLSGVRVPLR